MTGYSVASPLVDGYLHAGVALVFLKLARNLSQWQNEGVLKFARKSRRRVLAVSSRLNTGFSGI
jgi:hypothetical protein